MSRDSRTIADISQADAARALDVVAVAVTIGRERETELERLDRNLMELPAELRVALPGVQVLFAFLLVAAFNARFARVAGFERGLYLATLLITLLAAILLIAPTLQRRTILRTLPNACQGGFVALMCGAWRRGQAGIAGSWRKLAYPTSLARRLRCRAGRPRCGCVVPSGSAVRVISGAVRLKRSSGRGRDARR